MYRLQLSEFSQDRRGGRGNVRSGSDSVEQSFADQVQRFRDTLAHSRGLLSKLLPNAGEGIPDSVVDIDVFRLDRNTAWRIDPLLDRTYYISGSFP